MELLGKCRSELCKSISSICAQCTYILCRVRHNLLGMCWYFRRSSMEPVSGDLPYSCSFLLNSTKKHTSRCPHDHNHYNHYNHFITLHYMDRVSRTCPIFVFSILKIGRQWPVAALSEQKLPKKHISLPP